MESKKLHGKSSQRSFQSFLNCMFVDDIKAKSQANNSAAFHQVLYHEEDCENN